MAGLEDLLAAMGGASVSPGLGARRRREDPPSTPIEQLPEKLVEFADRYHRLEFSTGDLVTPRANSSLKDVGLPHIVVEVRAKADPLFAGNEVGAHGNPDFGARLNMRVAVEVRGRILAYWVEAYHFERWTVDLLPKDTEVDADE